MFHEMFGNSGFSEPISRNRFEYLVFYVSFDNHAKRPTSWQNNRFVAFCEIFEEFSKNCGKFLVPDDYLSLNEAFYPTRAQIKPHT